MVTVPRGCPARTPLGGRGFTLGLALWLLWASAYGWTYPPYGPYGVPPPAAQGPAPGQYPEPQPRPWQFRPTPLDNARGAPPAYLAPPPGQVPHGVPGQFPGRRPGQRPAQSPPGWPGGAAQPLARTQHAKQPPRLEWSIDDTRPYVQQNLVLRLQLISADELTTADPDLAGSDEVLMQVITQPTASRRNGPDGRELVTQFLLVLTPLRPGNLELPRFKVTGTRPGNGGAGERYEAVATHPVQLQVRPAMTAVSPWLPLRSLSLNAAIEQPPRVEPGQPVTLALRIEATGALAAQLPSLEGQLVSPDFRIYREQTLTDTRLSQDGRQLTAQRTEYYTLVPQGRGTLRLPALKVPWWSLETDTRQVATLPIRTLSIDGAGSAFGLPAALTDPGSGWAKVWLPIAGLLLVLTGYWGRVLYHRRRPGTDPRRKARRREGRRQAAVGLGRRTALTLSRLAPAALAAQARTTAVGLLPESTRLLLCVRDANQARDPGAWCERFEQSARRLLRTPGHRGTPNLTERILILRPRADRARLTQLMDQLDAARYGRQPLEFPRWKRDFMRQVGRAASLIRPRRVATRIRRATLPALNPRT